MNSVADDMKEIEWYHRIDLGNGVITPGQNRTDLKLKTLHMPERLDGKTVLDIGAWDGFFSFEAERRGASRVVAVDSYVWSIGRKRGFEYARRALSSRVEDRTVECTEISPETVGGTYDVVLFLGVLYHMRDPLMVLERVRSVTRHMLILETLIDLRFSRRPAMAYYPKDSLHCDATNFWGPNIPCVVAMLKEVGFTRIEVVSQMSLPMRLGKGLYDIKRGLLPPREYLYEAFNRGRAAFHAFIE